MGVEQGFAAVVDEQDRWPALEVIDQHGGLIERFAEVERQRCGLSRDLAHDIAQEAVQSLLAAGFLKGRHPATAIFYLVRTAANRVISQAGRARPGRGRVVTMNIGLSIPARNRNWENPPDPIDPGADVGISTVDCRDLLQSIPSKHARILLCWVQNDLKQTALASALGTNRSTAVRLLRDALDHARSAAATFAA